MKQSVPPAAIVAAIIVVIVIVGFIGFHVLAPSGPVNPNAPKGMSAEQKAQYEATMQNRGGSPGHPGGSPNH